jgi:hypothetical protein
MYAEDDLWIQTNLRRASSVLCRGSAAIRIELALTRTCLMSSSHSSLFAAHEAPLFSKRSQNGMWLFSREESVCA